MKSKSCVVFSSVGGSVPAGRTTSEKYSGGIKLETMKGKGLFVAEQIKNDTGSIRAIAKKYGIGKTQVGYIKQEKRWTE